MKKLLSAKGLIPTFRTGLLSSLAFAIFANSNAQMVVDTFSFTPLDNSIQQQCEGSIANIQRGEPAHNKPLWYRNL